MRYSVDLLMPIINPQYQSSRLARKSLIAEAFTQRFTNVLREYVEQNLEMIDSEITSEGDIRLTLNLNIFSDAGLEQYIESQKK